MHALETWTLNTQLHKKFDGCLANLAEYRTSVGTNIQP